MFKRYAHCSFNGDKSRCLYNVLLNMKYADNNCNESLLIVTRCGPVTSLRYFNNLSNISERENGSKVPFNESKQIEMEAIIWRIIDILMS